MFKTILILTVVAISGVAHAKKAKEMTEADYKEALACLDKINSGGEYKWTNGASPYKFDTKTKDHFVVLGKQNAFVRFGSTEPQKCDFKMDHNSTRDCVKITDANGADVVTMKYEYKDATKTACNPKNMDSTTKFKYDSASTCAKMEYKDLGAILQKQILTNTEKMIIDKKMSRQDFDASFRKSCEKIHGKLWDGIGMDFGATVSYAVKKAKENAVAQDTDKGTKEGVEGTSGSGTVDR